MYYKGSYLHDEMKKERVLEVEILQAARSQGLSSLEQAEAVVLESDGSFSVIKKSDKEGSSTLQNISKK
ncbi:Protein of uncharacterised function (DUF421) [Mycobacteroides abscessus subsp. abscessus]|nr:Protein of uncharacterised function (DUF421) [Mycobacteroides abscessus subsp. abscessus]